MKNLKKFILLSHIIFITINFANAQQKCLDTGNFTANSTYANNRYQILSSLAPNVSANNDRFFNTSIGEEPNKVYALGLCVLDITSESCFNCVNYTSQKVTEKCPNQKGAIFWEGAVGGPCLVRYSSSSFLGKLELDPLEAAGYSTGGASFNSTEFDPIWAALMERVVERASSGSSRVKYATEEVERPPFQNIYAQMQCTPYLSQSDCSKCLRANVASYKECCRDKLGGYAQRPSCTLRWNLVPFYNASVSPPAPPPPPSSSPRVTTNANEDDDGGIKPGTVAAIVVPTITFIAFFALTCIFLIRRRRKPSQEVENADEVASVEVRIKVVNVDREKSRIGLSIRRLEEDPLLKTSDKVIPQDGSAGLDSLDMSNTIEPLPGLDSILQELLQEDGIDEARIKRQGFEKRVVSQDLQLWLSNAPPLDNKSTLLARAGRQVQEIQLTTSLDQEGIKKALQRVLERVP